jgi:hypothetical protein
MLQNWPQLGIAEDRLLEVEPSLIHSHQCFEIGIFDFLDNINWEDDHRNGEHCKEEWKLEYLNSFRMFGLTEETLFQNFYLELV